MMLEVLLLERLHQEEYPGQDFKQIQCCHPSGQAEVKLADPSAVSLQAKNNATALTLKEYRVDLACTPMTLGLITHNATKVTKGRCIYQH